jgi:hypothetical protein
LQLLGGFRINGEVVGPARGGTGCCGLLCLSRLAHSGSSLVSTLAPNLIVVDLLWPVDCLVLLSWLSLHGSLPTLRWTTCFLRWSCLPLARSLHRVIHAIRRKVFALVLVHILQGLIRRWGVAMWTAPSALATVASGFARRARAVDALAQDGLCQRLCSLACTGLLRLSF